MDLHATHVGTATLLLELDGIALLTDPVFDGPASYHFGGGMKSKHLRGPYVELDRLPPIDAVLLSHDQHDDNLDAAGRTVIERAPTLLTTSTAQRRLGRGTGLRPFETHELTVRGQTLRITATPARHGPRFSLPLVGPVIGFLIEAPGVPDAIYISGDTVYFRGIDQIAARFQIGTAFLHLGGAAYMGMRFTMNAREGARAAKTLGARRIVPVHYDDWTHFKEPPDRIAPAFESAGLTDRLLRLPKGERTDLGA